MSEVTAEQIAAAEVAAPAPAEPAQQVPAVESGTTGGVDENEQADGGGDVPQQPARKPGGGFQRRIDELTRNVHQTQREKEQLLEIVRAAVGGGAKLQAEVPKPAADAEPVREADEDYEAYLRRLWRWESKQEVQQALKADREAKQADELQAQTRQVAEALTQRYTRAVDEFRDTHPDFDEVVGREDVKIPTHAAKLIGLRADAPILFYAMGKDPRLAAYLSQYDGNEHAIGMAVGEIAASLRLQPQVSNAPEPGNPVGRKAAVNSDPPSDMEGYMKWREKRGFR